jgi:hypothetical protein
MLATRKIRGFGSDPRLNVNRFRAGRQPRLQELQVPIRAHLEAR